MANLEFTTEEMDVFFDDMGFTSRAVQFEDTTPLPTGEYILSLARTKLYCEEHNNQGFFMTWFDPVAELTRENNELGVASIRGTAQPVAKFWLFSKPKGTTEVRDYIPNEVGNRVYQRLLECIMMDPYGEKALHRLRDMVDVRPQLSGIKHTITRYGKDKVVNGYTPTSARGYTNCLGRFLQAFEGADYHEFLDHPNPHENDFCPLVMAYVDSKERVDFKTKEIVKNDTGMPIIDTEVVRHPFPRGKKTPDAPGWYDTFCAVPDHILFEHLMKAQTSDPSQSSHPKGMDDIPF